MKMDSRIPKPSGSKKPAPGSINLFDFKTFKSNPDQQKKPLSEINNLTTAPLTNRRAKSPDFHRSEPLAVPKMRRSKSAMDFRADPLRAGAKRFQTALETVPTKRLKTGPSNSRPIMIRSQAKQTAILNTLKSASSSNIVSTQAKKPLIKTSSNGAPSTSKAPLTKAPIKPAAPAKAAVPAKAATKNIAAKNRIPPYDFKARHAALLEKFNALKAKNDEQKELLATLEEQSENTEQRERELTNKLEANEQELFEANEEKEKLKVEIQELRAANSHMQTKNTALASSLAAASEELSDLKMKQEKLEQTALDYEKLKERSSGLQHEIEEASSKLMMSQDQLYSINAERMVLHNMVLDLRGNIRVFARVRPPLGIEGDKSLCGWSFNDESTLEIHNNEIVQMGTNRKQTKHEFAFDQVFNPHTTQEEIFEMVSPLIQSALDGYNVCIFAYGQTGSGKTFTMEGAEGKMGIIPRTVKLLFDSTKTASILGWEYTITASFLEIYNEVLYDLLSNDEKDVEIRMANAKCKTEIYVSNLTQEQVTSAEQLYQLMRIAGSHRATAATAGNERSSRSHAVTRLEIVGRHPSRPESLIGFINLVDLAGSESPKTSVRMEETKNINRSLSELSNVILALVQKNEHVPYRNSKLTHLLMPSLGGNSKTLMFVNVSPFQENFIESVKSLRFAAQVNTCKLAKAKRNRQLNVSNASSLS